MKVFELHVELPTGAVLVGGYSALPVGASSAHARDGAGRPLIPATALRGALRESLEALLRGAGMPACEAGTGIEPRERGARDGDRAPGPCIVDGGGRCVACRLFGSQRRAREAGERGFSALILGDAHLGSADADHEHWVERQQVAIDRRRRSAAEGHLFTRLVPDLHGRRLTAQGSCDDPELATYFEAAVRATKSLGAGRSTGLGRVELQLVWGDPSPAPATAPSDATGATLELRLTLESPMLIAGAQVGDNYRPTRREIPGSALRGAIGSALARVLEDAETTPGFQELVDEEQGAHFGFLFPSVDAEQRAEPWPLTARACKRAAHEHGVVDTLFDRLAAQAIESVDQVPAVEARALRRCSSCGAPLRSVAGNRGGAKHALRIVTRAATDRRSSTTREGALFSQERIESGAAFRGSIRNLAPAARELLAQALTLPLFVGRGASAGWGRVGVEVIDEPDPPDLRERGLAFMQALADHFSQAGLPMRRIECWLPLLSLSPLLPEAGDADGRRTLEQAVGKVAAWPLVARRFVREGGWDQQRGQPFAELALTAGAVHVVELSGPWDDPTVLERLRALEREGVGRRRHQGFGHIRCFDPIFLRRSSNP